MVVKQIGLVSLSMGLLGEEAVAHEVEIGLQRLREKNVAVTFLPHACKGVDYLANHPEKRASDLLQAFSDHTIDLILCAIGGNDTVRLAPDLFGLGQLQAVATQKLFLGFSDTTVNHFMLQKLGLYSFYGQAFLPDVCEIGPTMLPYSKRYFDELLSTGQIAEIRPSDVWYTEREDFSLASVGTALDSHIHTGFELLRGAPVFEGVILGGCLETIYELLDPLINPTAAALNQRYALVPKPEEWRGKILLLETSEEKPTPEYFRKMIVTLREAGLFEEITGLLFGKPQNGQYEREYQRILLEEIDRLDLSIVGQVNVGHAQPRCIVPLGVPAVVNAKEQVIRFDWSAVKKLSNEGMNSDKE